MKRPDHPGEKQTLPEVILYKNHSHHLHPHCWGAHLLCGRGTKAPGARRNSPHRPLGGASRGSPSAGVSSEVPPTSGSPTTEKQSTCLKGQQTHSLGLESQRPRISFANIKDTPQEETFHKWIRTAFGDLVSIFFPWGDRDEVSKQKEMCIHGYPGKMSTQRQSHFLPSTLLCHLGYISQSLAQSRLVHRRNPHQVCSDFDVPCKMRETRS